MKTILPVVHVVTLQQALDNVGIAKEVGANGIFLINHDVSDQDLLAIHDSVADSFPDFWTGVNCLGLTPDEVFCVISEKVHGVWADNAGIEEHTAKQEIAETVLSIKNKHVPNCRYFGGVAFKYQRPVEDLEAACEIAPRYMDVVTTSGRGTGHAADVDKIRRMKKALGEYPLAIASGVTPENVEDYLPYVDYFLVATGVSKSHTEFDQLRLRELVSRVLDYDDKHAAR